MTDFRRILLHGGWNLLGTALPLAAAVAALPFLLRSLGVERFGVLSLVWVLIGYFGFLDLGIGRALTKLVAERSGSASRQQIQSLCSTGTIMVCALGGAGALVIALAAMFPQWWSDRVPTEILPEVQATALLVAISIPAVVCTAALRGILEGFQEFRTLNLIRIPAGVAMFVAPCLTAALSPRLDLAVAALAVTRILFLVVHARACWKLCPLALRSVRREWLGPMLTFGGWLTVSSTIGPIIVYLDRFVIAALLPAAAVGYYSAPFEVVARLLILPMALCGAIFPALARLGPHDRGARVALERKALGAIVAVVTPIAVLGIFGAQWLLEIWLGSEFSREGTLPMQILLVGFAFNAISQLPLAALHSLGRTRQTAILHLVELPIYVVLLVWLVREHGLPGAAAAWTLRAMFDTLALKVMLLVAHGRPFNSSTSCPGNALVR
jgi:O-antigen/teichoic acid export membrane protein